MKVITTIVFALALTAPGLATAADPNYGCDSVNFGPEVLEKIPNAKKLCRGITEKNDGVYVHYIAEVESKSASAVTIKFLDKDNKGVSRVTFEPMSDQIVMLDKKPIAYTRCRRDRSSISGLPAPSGACTRPRRQGDEDRLRRASLRARCATPGDFDESARQRVDAKGPVARLAFFLVYGRADVARTLQNRQRAPLRRCQSILLTPFRPFAQEAQTHAQP